MMMVSLHPFLVLCGTDVINDEDNGGWHTNDEDRIRVSARCNLERRNAEHLSQSDFQSRYAFSEPVIIFNVQNDRFRERTHKETMLNEWADEAVTLNSANTYSSARVASTFGDYVRELMKPQLPNSLGNETLYLFGDIDPYRWAPLLDEYNQPKWQLPDHQPALSFGIAGAGTGVPFHFHGPVFAEVIYGAKQWFLYPFEQQPEFDPDRSSLDWYLNDYPKLERTERPLECLLKPGEVIYIPDKWWHATLNTETSVFMSTFLSPSMNLAS
ncbi:unnamed protein product [Anisakis simplex]|uniref:JmjC domain-containing protein n=1 Tax=Anisakis simplex TaxID=6269 RepID=A0A0M3K6P6_ANISI|nr:unnamed protein product [Anisakis simplex]